MFFKFPCIRSFEIFVIFVKYCFNLSTSVALGTMCSFVLSSSDIANVNVDAVLVNRTP